MQRRRPALLLIAVALAGYASVSAPSLPMRASLFLGSAAVGISAAVQTNSDNALAQELREREAELDRREALIRDAEAESAFWRISERLAPFSFLVSFILFALIALNYFFDWRRSRRGYTKSA